MSSDRFSGNMALDLMSAMSGIDRSDLAPLQGATLWGIGSRG